MDRHLPSVQWNRQMMIGRMERLLANSAELNGDLYLASADETGMLLGGIRKLCALLGERSPRGFRWSYQRFEDENHGTVPHQAMYLGLTKIFDLWDVVNPFEQYERSGLDGIARRFRDASRRYGVERRLWPFALSMIVAGLMEQHRAEEAESVLLHDTKAFPPPANQLDRLAREYALLGDKAGEIRCYKLLLERDPKSEPARKRLAELGVAP
ncbi:MAG: hypothetical protein SFV54_20760 [Bryobacteraceae bacterium]|nr:hypothetical protein [Bryobacteraceae bacterium]